MVDVRRVDRREAGDAALVARVTEVVNRAYAEAEVGLFTTDNVRTTVEHTAEAIRNGHIVVALQSDEIVGAVRVRPHDADTWWFGALGVDPPSARAGVGGALVAFAEETAAAAGAGWMQLEVLEADPPLQHLVWLAAWYRRRGYRETARTPLDELHPEDAGSLTRACDVVEMRRPLEPPSPA